MRQRPLVPLNNEKGTSESRRGKGIIRSQNSEEGRHGNQGGARGQDGRIFVTTTLDRLTSDIFDMCWYFDIWRILDASHCLPQREEDNHVENSEEVSC